MSKFARSCVRTLGIITDVTWQIILPAPRVNLNIWISFEKPKLETSTNALPYRSFQFEVVMTFIAKSRRVIVYKYAKISLTISMWCEMLLIYIILCIWNIKYCHVSNIGIIENYNNCLQWCLRSDRKAAVDIQRYHSFPLETARSSRLIDPYADINGLVLAVFNELGREHFCLLGGSKGDGRTSEQFPYSSGYNCEGIFALTYRHLWTRRSNEETRNE